VADEYEPRPSLLTRALHGTLPTFAAEYEDKRKKIEYGISVTNWQTMKNLEAWLMTGCFTNEQNFSWEPPRVEETPDLIIVHERFRML
jgi:hypothetical protein